MFLDIDNDTLYTIIPKNKTICGWAAGSGGAKPPQVCPAGGGIKKLESGFAGKYTFLFTRKALGDNFQQVVT